MTTIGDVPGAPTTARARDLLDRVAPTSGTAVATQLAPFTGVAMPALPQLGADDVRRAVRRAREAQVGWAATPVVERARVLRRLHDLVLDRQAEVLDLMQVETGKSRVDAFDEVAVTALTAAHYAHTAPRLLAPHRRAGAFPVFTRTTELRHPKGVVSMITPWNYPLALTGMDALPALVAGNALVQKPDNQTALTVLWLHEQASEAGLPDGVWQIVPGDGPTIGPALIEEGDYLGFTGSTATGRALATSAAALLTGFSLELGGKNPMIVLPDADVDKAAAGAVTACFSSAGQLCVAMERVYVHDDIREAFLNAFARKTTALRLGSTLDYGPQVGSLTSDRQLGTITSHVEDARAHGATVLTGGRPRPDLGPLFYEPTILTGVTPAMRVYAEETFGPVVSVYGYSDVDEAVERANDTRYGLNASVWTRSRAAGEAVAARIKAGSVNVNDGFGSALGSVAAPMGGMGDSGMGRRGGSEGLLKYTEAQTIAAQRLVPLRGGPIPARVWNSTLTAAIRVMRRLPR